MEEEINEEVCQHSRHDYMCNTFNKHDICNMSRSSDSARYIQLEHAMKISINIYIVTQCCHCEEY